MRGDERIREIDEVEVGRRLVAAEAICSAHGQRLNAPGRRVLKVLLSQGRPLKAYDLMHALADRGRSAAPPTVYRALKFLTEMGLAHRIESLNAFVACRFLGEPHLAGFHICERCHAVEEFQVGAIPLPAGSRREGRLILEVLTDCSNCADGGSLERGQTDRMKGR